MAAPVASIASIAPQSWQSKAGFVALSIALSASPYATASGGLSVDLTTLLAQFAGTASSTVPVPNQNPQLQYAEMVDAKIPGAMVDATPHGYLAVPTKTSANIFTVRIFGGASYAEIADGNLTGTLYLTILVAVGSRSYNT